MTFFTRRKTPEHDFQKTAIQWLGLALEKPAFAISIDHAGKDRLTGALRKARGVPAGLADVWVFHPQGVVCLELKSAIGRPSDAQLAMSARLSACNIWTYTCRTLEDIEVAMDNRRVKLRRRLDPRSLSGARAIA